MNMGKVDVISLALGYIGVLLMSVDMHFGFVGSNAVIEIIKLGWLI
jgi:hypothetical protein